MEIDSNVKRKEVEGLIREMMAGPRGKEMRKTAAGWKESAAKACRPRGDSEVNLERVVNEVLLRAKETNI
ncbi:UDP-glycosyltransferase 85A3 [Apostasia shenzhenica]|uniref:UDP-glycosyltransferase 85A3 n=1 Tax=Apostasia shenzhenica TaxID=1088818 RepID=A0A2I0ANA1_9ASPA|nr:UDP-glycosyltransferase 85A3 [Apostasia shenzhenica]